MIGNLYFIQEGDDGSIKIGWTRNDPRQRMRNPNWRRRFWEMLAKLEAAMDAIEAEEAAEAAQGEKSSAA
jgi:hypothetical protein